MELTDMPICQVRFPYTKYVYGRHVCRKQHINLKPVYAVSSEAACQSVNT